MARLRDIEAARSEAAKKYPELAMWTYGQVRHMMAAHRKWRAENGVATTMEQSTLPLHTPNGNPFVGCQDPELLAMKLMGQAVSAMNVEALERVLDYGQHLLGKVRSETKAE